jgi:hypothetical protein
MPMASVPARVQELEPDAEIVVICHHGGRSMQVAMFLERQGFSNLINLAGGVAQWAAAGRSVHAPVLMHVATNGRRSDEDGCATCGSCTGIGGPDGSGRDGGRPGAGVSRCLGLRRGPGLGARASREAGLEKLPQGRAGLLPSLSVTGNTTWNDLTLKHLNPDPVATTATAGRPSSPSPCSAGRTGCSTSRVSCRPRCPRPSTSWPARI